MASGERAGAGLVVWVVLVVAAVLIGAGILDSAHLAATDHAGPVPAKVIELSRDAYIIRPGAAATPNGICVNEPSGYAPRSTVIPEVGVYIRCVDRQRWNQHGSRGNYADSLWDVVTWTYFLPLALLALGACLAPVVPELVRERKRGEVERDQLEDQRSALAAAYAKDEISDAEFNHGMDRLYRG